MAKFATHSIKNLTVVVKPTYTTVTNGFPSVVHGKRLKFEEGELITTDNMQISFLRKHKDFGIKFFEVVEQVINPKTKTAAKV